MAPRSRRDRPALSREVIAQATLELIDEQGVGVATMRTIGTRLGVQGMSLYTHVKDREDLLDAVVDLIVAELDDDPEVLRTAEHGWRDYLTRLARGVRRYAIAHPHAFPLVTTRPAEAPWINPPLRSLAWIESVLQALSDEGFDDTQVVFAYRSFNSFLLGYLLMETGARTLRDPKTGDGEFAEDQPVPGGLSANRDAADEEVIADAEDAIDLLDPSGKVDEESYPTIHRLAGPLAEDRYEAEFERALTEMLDGIAARVD